jgi:hypothetical protein
MCPDRSRDAGGARAFIGPQLPVQCMKMRITLPSFDLIAGRNCSTALEMPALSQEGTLS